MHDTAETPLARIHCVRRHALRHLHLMRIIAALYTCIQTLWYYTYIYTVPNLRPWAYGVWRRGFIIEYHEWCFESTPANERGWVVCFLRHRNNNDYSINCLRRVLIVNDTVVRDRNEIKIASIEETSAFACKRREERPDRTRRLT